MDKEILKKEQEKLKKEIESIYTPLSVARKEIQKRWEDKELKKKVDDFLGNDLPEFLKDNPKAYLARHLISPNYDFLKFLKMAESAEINFICPEFIKDKFVAKNVCKYHLGKLYFHDGKGKNGGDKISTLKVIDFNVSEGKKIEELKTLWGENFVEFHHRILGSLVPNIDKKLVDISSWFDKKGKTPEKFYVYFLALFLRNCILFENFLINKDESNFTKKIVLPNIYKLEEIFGIKPLIVRLLPIEKEADQCWLSYPGFIRELVKNSKIIKEV